MAGKKSNAIKRRSPNGNEPRDSLGRFLVGSAGGPGNPLGARVFKIRELIYSAVSDEDVRTIIRNLVLQAKDGNLAAIHEILDRLVGKARSPVDVESIRPIMSLLDFAVAVRRSSEEIRVNGQPALRHL